MKTVIGIDFGSDSARAILADLRGNILNESVFSYPRSVFHTLLVINISSRAMPERRTPSPTPTSFS